MMQRSIDPRLGNPGEADIRPLVARKGAGTPIWLAGSIVILGAVLLFSVLDGQRRARTAPATQVEAVDGVQRQSPLPPLYLVQDSIDVTPPLGASLPAPVTPPPPLPPVQAAPFAQQLPPVYSLPPVLQPAMPVLEPQRATAGGDVLVIDTTATGNRPAGLPQPNDPASAERAATDASPPTPTDPIRTRRQGRRTMLVPQGTLIPAVLETALDSTRPGQVRALVSRDVKGFDGSQILIPRGSRLFGEYEADLKPGQNRAVVRWTRLVRPDGVSSAIDSPAADRLGRAGVQGRVDNHFLERFGSAVLQSTLNLGAGFAGRSLNGDAPVIVTLPGSTQGAGTFVSGSQVQPTLGVEAGTTVSVFVSRDLEFPPGELRQ